MAHDGQDLGQGRVILPDLLDLTGAAVAPVEQVFEAARARVRALVSIDLGGEKARTHAVGEHLMRYEVAPDDRHFAFRQNYHVFALPLPPGGKALSISTKVASVNMTQASGDGGNYPNWANGGTTLAWTLGATLFDANVDELFALADDEGEGGPHHRRGEGGGEARFEAVEERHPGRAAVERGLQRREVERAFRREPHKEEPRERQAEQEDRKEDQGGEDNGFAAADTLHDQADSVSSLRVTPTGRPPA